jgi:hypothetical protein
MSVLSLIRTALEQGKAVPYLGAGALAGAVDIANGEAMPADSDSLILAMNNGRPMAAKLMYEFPRAAMNLELKRGRRFINQFLTHLYQQRQWTSTPLHTWLASLRLPYIIDTNRDLLLQNAYVTTPHTLIAGLARTGGTDYRFRLYQHDGHAYTEIPLADVDNRLPILFKPLGTPSPEPHYIASDADYVDYLTELMGGFAIPPFLKMYRQERRYVLLGLPLNRDTERMLLSDITHACAKDAGWALLPQATDKERRFCAKLGLEVVEANIADLLAQEDNARACA